MKCQLSENNITKEGLLTVILILSLLTLSSLTGSFRSPGKTDWINNLTFNLR